MLLRTLSIIVTAATASYVPRTAQTEADQGLCVYLGVDNTWNGNGMLICAPPGFCGSYTIDTTTKLNDAASMTEVGLEHQVSSAQPDLGVACYLYSEEHCQGEISGKIVYPGIVDLNDINLNDKAMSWMCQKA